MANPQFNPALVGTQYGSLIGSALFRQKRERYGGNVELQFKPTDDLEIVAEGPDLVVTCSPDLLAEMDRAIERGDYKGRSEFLRAAIRTHLQDRHPPAGRHVHGSLTVTYPHGKEARMSEVRHAFHDVVLSLMHTHCEPETCMDVLLVGGAPDRVQLKLYRGGHMFYFNPDSRSAFSHEVKNFYQAGP